MPRIFGILAPLAAVLLVACGRQEPPRMPPPVVGVVVMKEQPVPITVELPGRTDPYAVSEVRPQVSGIILHRLFREGSTVKAGQPLYQIDPAPYQAAYDSAKAALAAAKAKAERYAALAKVNAIAPQDNDDAQAAYLQAKAALESARINLNWTRITAPISGRISASSVTEGALVTAQQADALATISTLDPIYVDINQSSAELIALKRAIQAGHIDSQTPLTAEVTLTFDDGSTYPHKGRLEFTDVTVDPTTGAVRLRAIFPNPEGMLLPGLFVRATITEGIDPHAILAPQQGIGRDQKGDPTALVVDSHDIVQLRQIRTGQAIGPDWLVLSGLKPGDRLIVEGVQKVTPGMKVKPAPAQNVKP